MSKLFNIDNKISEIAIAFPKAVDIFKEYKIDFCCGGNRLLKDALEEKNLDKNEVIDKINQLYSEFKDEIDKTIDFENMALDKLVDYIVNVHHAYLYENLPKVGELTKKILRVHGTHHPFLSKVHKLFNTLSGDLEEHLISEETVQFPAIKQYFEKNDINALNIACNEIGRLESEHVEAGDILKELRGITNDFKAPDDACPSFLKTYQMIQEIESDLFQHVHLENNILYPRLFALREKNK